MPDRDPNLPGPARDARALQAAKDSVAPARLLPGEEGSVASAESSREPDNLLPGEDPVTVLIDDVDHWIAVYSELLEFKRFMLDGAATRAASMTQAESRHEVEVTDLTVARAEAERFSRRLAYWRGRRDVAAQSRLEAGPPS